MVVVKVSEVVVELGLLLLLNFKLDNVVVVVDGLPNPAVADHCLLLYGEE